MSLGVFSEIGPLRRVLVHRPGHEIDWMVPSLMDRLLFDDILHGEDARREHDVFTGVLAAAGAEVLEIQDLLADVLTSPEVLEEALGWLIENASLTDEALAELRAAEAPALADQLISGRLRHAVHGERLSDFYRLAPVPNYFFQRDPQVVFGSTVLVAAMATEARRREAFLSRLVFEHHPQLQADERIALDADDRGARRAQIEGGDLLVASPEVLLIGVSERTNRYAIDRLAQRLLRRDGGFRSIVVVEIPAKRSYMHLDTVFTFIDHGVCLAYPPVIEPDGSEAGDVYRIDLDAREVAYTLCDDLPSALAGLGLEIELVPCGGAHSLIDQQREQWTDGANAFAVAPGVILLYRRNRRTADVLDARGWRVVDGETLASGAETIADGEKVVVTLPDNELSRARGGPRCMTMPLEREPLA
ncbi:MAG: arginine deiminase family protein [Acidobacteriota bacterium]